MGMIVFSDFNCPFCYVFNERLRKLGHSEQVEWRGVQHAPDLLIPMRATRAASTELAREVKMIRDMAPEIIIAEPSAKPNSGPAIRLMADMLMLDRTAAYALKDRIFTALWIDGVDISSSTILHNLASGVSRLVVENRPTDSAIAQAVRWDRQWRESGLSSVPSGILPNGKPFQGMLSAEDLRRYLA